jgi:hypothetical protein
VWFCIYCGAELERADRAGTAFVAVGTISTTCHSSPRTAAGRPGVHVPVEE